jgi:hypothetical protein
MHLNMSCVIDTFLIKYFLALLRALYFLSLELTSSAHVLYVGLAYLILENVFFSQVSNSKH